MTVFAEHAYDFFSYASIVLHLLLILFLLRVPGKKYVILLVYCVAQLVTAVWEFTVRTQSGTGTLFYRYLYWTDEVVLALLLFLMVVILTYQAIGDNPLRAKLGKLLGIVFVAVVLLPFVVIDRPLWNTRWFNHTSQFLSFGGAIMNLALWVAILSNRKRDRYLLTVSAGLGILVTGAAISFGVRSYTPKEYRWIPNLFLTGTHVVCMMIWCWAFRPQRKSSSPAPAPLPTTESPSLL